MTSVKNLCRSGLRKSRQRCAPYATNATGCGDGAGPARCPRIRRFLCTHADAAGALYVRTRTPPVLSPWPGAAQPPSESIGADQIDGHTKRSTTQRQPGDNTCGTNQSALVWCAWPNVLARAQSLLTATDHSNNGKPAPDEAPSPALRAEDPAPHTIAPDGVAPDFSEAVVADLYRYTEKRPALALFICVTTGIFGGHRFYLNQPASAFAMLFSLGGGIVWWIVDMFRVGDMVRRYNKDQRERRAQGLPPRALSFMPPLDGKPLPARPHWAKHRDRRGQITGGAIVLFIAGFGLGTVSSATGNPEAIVAVFALIAITLVGARWPALATLPLLRGFDRWSHRLRLYYFITDPGGLFNLALRPIAHIFAAPWRKRAWAEVRLYLELGAWFTILFGILDIFDAIDEQGSFSLIAFALDLAVTLVIVYAFAAPIGAILNTQLLLSRRDSVVWVLSCVAVVAISLGWWVV